MTAGRAIRVLVADDSPLFRELLSTIIGGQPGFKVVAVAANGDDAATLAHRHRPDVITMDLTMPDSDGFAGIASIMAETPTPILVLTATRTERIGFKALALGALDILEKPGASEDLAAYGAVLRHKLRLLAGVPVIRHVRGLQRSRFAGPARRARAELVVIGASLGGPHALATILKALPATFPVPIAVVQHIADGFTDGLADWLSQEGPLPVRVAHDGDALRAGQVLLAPSGAHLLVGEREVRLSDAAPVDTFRPSVTPLFESAARSHGARACGVLLTGMGRDGAAGLLTLRSSGATTVAQDEATSAVFGMPRAAIELGAVDRVLPLEEIPRSLEELTR